MKLKLSIAATTAAFVVACATPYDPKQHRNIETLEQAPPDLDALLPPRRTPAPTAAPVASSQTQAKPTLDDDFADVGKARKAVENYRQILELSPNDRVVKWEAQRRLADLQVEISELDPESEAKGIASTENSIDLYNSLLDSRPDDPNNDRILYQLARAYQNTGQVGKAIESLAELTRTFPQTTLWTDAEFRRAELLFNQRDYEPAEIAYKAVLDRGADGNYFEQAQYKYGWAVFKQERYKDSLDTFISILDRELPVGAVENLDATLEVVPRAQRELVTDVLRVVSLSFSYLGGGTAITEYLQGRPVRSFEPVLYENLAKLFLEKGRFNDAARSYSGLAERSPTHKLAPKFQARVIDVYDKAGFADQVLQAKVDYVEKYDLDQVYWSAHSPEDSPEAYEMLRANMDELARHWHTGAQQAKTPADKARLFGKATQTYARYLNRFEDADNRPEMNFLLAEAFFQSGNNEKAAEEFSRTAWNYPAHKRSSEAGYAAVLARQNLIEGTQGEARGQRVRESVATSLKFADSFAGHPEQPKVLMRAAEDLYAIKQADQAITLATRVTTLQSTAAQALQAPAWTLIGFAHMDQKRYPEAEKGLSEALKRAPAQSEQATELRDNLASAIYRQGEQARDAQQLDVAIGHFLRVKQVQPGGKLAAAGDFDAAAALIEQENWSQAAQVLLSFRQSYPRHELQAEVTRKLAGIYLKDDKPLLAAAEFERIARSQPETAPARREAAWQAASLYDKAKSLAQAETAYAFFATTYTQPYGQVLKAHERLIELSDARGDRAANRGWLNALIARENAAGAQSSPRGQTLAAQASLTLANDIRGGFDRLRLSAPLNRSLPTKKAAMDKALAAYQAVTRYAIAEFTTEATFQIGELYANFSKALMKSERPRGLSELELEEYQFLLEDQAFPLEEKAIEVHASNIARTKDKIYDKWVRASYTSLASLLPARYGKTERLEVILETLD
ncbi:MAG: tetratricopeptide repeat protein [Oceanococcus sp.]